ncbi:hypothetical protein IX326_000488 [Porphyromonas levii]|nr:hypothetical protein [Porphyromonas levii]
MIAGGIYLATQLTTIFLRFYGRMKENRCRQEMSKDKTE